MTDIPFGCNGSKSLVQLRFLCPTDVPRVKQLCSDWFPIEYPDSWYEDITSNPKFFALAAILHTQIVGLIVAEIKCQTNCNREDRGLLASSLPVNSRVVYILTLGVVKEFRRNGIATLLLDNLINHLTTNPVTNDCKALYLHVLTTNLVAIRFYENRQFNRHLFLPLYYSINSTARDGFSYVLYINGGRPEVTLLLFFYYIRNVGPNESSEPLQMDKAGAPTLRFFGLSTDPVVRHSQEFFTTFGHVLNHVLNHRLIECSF